MSKTRIYAVPEAGADTPPRLVEAATRAQAIAHVVHSRFSAFVPTQKELVAALQAGSKVEIADVIAEGEDARAEADLDAAEKEAE